MKPPLFHIGQAIVCIENQWQNEEEGERPGGPDPQKGGLYTVSELVAWGGFWYLGLTGFVHDEYREDGFAPVQEMPAEAYAELLEALEPITA